MDQGIIVKVRGPIVVASGMSKAKMYELVYVSLFKLIGEIIELKGDIASIQVYEDTSLIGPGEPVYLTGDVLKIELGPGLIETIYDGIQRPLKIIEKKSGSAFISRGIETVALDREKKWDFKPTVKIGETVVAGDILGTIKETTFIEHKIMVPPDINGIIKSIEFGNKNVEDIIAVITTDKGEQEIQMMQKWSIRKPRPYVKKRVPNLPLITGNRFIDMFFPILKGSSACITGSFGSGKTVIQKSLAKYCDAQIIIYVGCGERGNEIAEILTNFHNLKDINNGEPLMRRTIIIANTSNMPVVSRESSLYVGITIGEYYRDMGYHVAMIADSISNWAEAMREISNRLEEMPANEGYPAYLGSRIAQFYERSGFVQTLGSEVRNGSLSVIGSISPPGGDLFEPVTQNTFRVTKTVLVLDSELAYKNHFPAINFLNSYSLYVPNLIDWWKINIAEDYQKQCEDAMKILHEEARIKEIIKFVGFDYLSSKDKLIIFVSRPIRENFLFQDSLSKEDKYTIPKKSYNILKTIMTVYYTLLPIIEKNVEFEFKNLIAIKVLEEIPNAKKIKAEDINKFEDLQKKIKKEINLLK